MCLKWLNLYNHCFYRYCDPLVFIINNKPTQNIHTSKFCFMIFFAKKFVFAFRVFLIYKRPIGHIAHRNNTVIILTYKSSSDPISLQYQEKLFFSLIYIYDKLWIPFLAPSKPMQVRLRKTYNVFMVDCFINLKVILSAIPVKKIESY